MNGCQEPEVCNISGSKCAVLYVATLVGKFESVGAGCSPSPQPSDRARPSTVFEVCSLIYFFCRFSYIAHLSACQKMRMRFKCGIRVGSMFDSGFR